MGDYVDYQGVHMLPDELLLQIFAQLSRQELGRAAQACKRWQRVCYDPSLYKSVELSRASYEPGTLGFVLERGTERLTIKGQADAAAFKESFFLDEMTLRTSYRLKQLINGSLHKGVPLILGRCRHLTDVRLITPSLNHDLMRALAETAGLEHLRIITHDQGPSFEETITMVRGCRRLRVFNCHGYTNTLTSREMFKLAGELPHTIEETNLFCSSECTSNEHVALLVKCLPNLVELHLQHCPRLTDQTFHHLKALQYLEKLNITVFPDLPVEAFGPLNQIKSLKMLAIFGSIARIHFNALKDLLPNLQVAIQVYLSLYTPRW